MTWNGQFCPICNFSNLYPPKWLRMTQNGQFHLQLFQSFPLKWLRMTGNGQFCPIHNFSNLFPPKWLGMTGNGQFHQIRNFSNLFPLKYLRMTWNGQFHLIHSFSNLFPPKWLIMTWNGQFHLIHNFSNIFPPKWLRMIWNGLFQSFQFCMAKIREFLWTISLLHGQMCPKRYGFLVLNMNTIEFFSIAFMFSTTYLRLEGKVPPPAQLILF